MNKQVELIKAEIERYKKVIGAPLLSDNDLIIGERNACNYIIKLINSLPEEPVSEDLETEIQRYYVDWDEHPEYVQTARHFAQWKEQQMMKKAINALWHDAKDEPDLHRKYLVRYNDERVNGSWERQSNVIPWKDVVKEHHFTHWCYVEDLIPKSK